MKMMNQKTEYKVSFNRKDRHWQVFHKHNYPNHNMSHPVYVGYSWTFCMWIATGDSFYIDTFDELMYGLIRTSCGARASDYGKFFKARKRLIESH